jgi:hypothetical protein
MHRAKGGSLRAGLADARHKRGRRKAKVTKNVSVKFFHEVHVFLVENDHRSECGLRSTSTTTSTSLNAIVRELLPFNLSVP